MLIFLLCGCSNIKTTYISGKLDPNGYPEKKLFEKFNAGTKDKSVIVFTSGFENDTIKIINSNVNGLKKLITSSENTGFSTLIVVSNDSKTEVYMFTDNPVKISLKQNDLKKYKFVYISKSVFKKDQYQLEYSNKWRRFL